MKSGCNEICREEWEFQDLPPRFAEISTVLIQQGLSAPVCLSHIEQYCHHTNALTDRYGFVGKLHGPHSQRVIKP